jgi:putative tricarboxylic transport membrane protein
MRAADLITASILILLGALVIVDAMRLGVGWGMDGPKSGFFPFWLALIMILCCAIIMAQQALKAGRHTFVAREKLRPVLTVLWPAILAVALMQWLGLYVASALYMGFYMRWVGRHSWVTVILVSLGVPVVTFWVFERWFYVPMPKGPLDTWLGY